MQGIAVSWMLLLALSLSAPAAAAEIPAAARLTAAGQALEQGRFEDVISRLAGLAPDDPAAPRAAFLRAYARFKLGQLARARAIVDSLLRAGFSPQVSLLGGMIAFEDRRWDQAVQLFDAVVSAGERPWADKARQLSIRAGQERARAQAQERARAQAQRRAQVARAHDEALAQVKLHIRSGDLDGARRALKRAEAARPHQLLPRYYRGYIAFQEKRYGPAKRHFESALATAPGDDWSRYMMALTLEQQGKIQRARSLLTLLLQRAQKPGVRKVSRQALIRMEVPGGARKGLELSLEAGTGLDTNPRVQDELPADSLDAAGMAIHLAGRLSYTIKPSATLAISPGFAALERLYAVGGDGYEQTEISPWLTLGLSFGAFRIAGTYGYRFDMLGHHALRSTHVGHLEVGVRVKPWLHLTGTGGGGAHDIHDPAFTYLEGAEAGGGAAAVFIWTRGQLGLQYDVVRRWSEPVRTTFTTHDPAGTGSGSGSGQGGKKGGTSPNSTTYTFVTDYSHLGHGPSLWGRVHLPWRLELRAGVGLRWRRFFSADSLGDPAAVQTVLEERSDIRLSARAEVARGLPAGLELAIVYESVDNFSTISSDEHGLNRNFSRRLVTLALRWTWPT